MKNYVIAFLIVIILLFLSILYRDSNSPALSQFPGEFNEKANENAPLFLYIFFSKNNCRDCMKMIHVLNDLSLPFIVKGIVPKEEIKNIEELRSVTSANFSIEPISRKYLKLTPIMWPALYGVSKKGLVLFIMPGFPGLEKELKNLIEHFYLKAKLILR